jgi:hypothetical protein
LQEASKYLAIFFFCFCVERASRAQLFFSSFEAAKLTLILLTGKTWRAAKLGAQQIFMITQKMLNI